MGLRTMDMVEFDDVGVVQLLQNLDFVFEHFQPRSRKTFHFDHFDCALSFVLSRPFIDTGTVPGSDLVRDFVGVISDSDFVFDEAGSGRKQFGSGAPLSEMFGLASAVSFGGRDELVWRVMPLTHFLAI